MKHMYELEKRKKKIQLEIIKSQLDQYDKSIALEINHLPRGRGNSGIVGKSRKLNKLKEDRAKIYTEFLDLQGELNGPRD